MKTSKDIADEVWRMLPDDCKNIMKPIKKSFKESIIADVDDLVKNCSMPTVSGRDSVESHYSGNASKPFWGIVHSLKNDADRQELYSLGVALQNHEEHVLRALWQIKKRYVRGWKNYR